MASNDQNKDTKVTAEGINGDKSVGFLSPEILAIIESAKKNALFIRLDDVDKNDASYLNRENVIAQLKDKYHVGYVYLDSNGEIVDENDATSTAIVIMGDKNKPKIEITKIKGNKTKRTPKGVSKNDECDYPLNCSSQVPKYPDKVNGNRPTWGEILPGVIAALNGHYEREYKRNPNAGSVKKCPLDSDSPTIKYINGEPDFDDLNFGEVTMDMYMVSDDPNPNIRHRKDRDVNFRRANELMAEKLNKRWKVEHGGICRNPQYTADDVENYMSGKTNPPGVKLTWHEKQDAKTMQKVPTLLHQNIDHSGGISMESSRTNDTRIGNYKDCHTHKLLANQPQRTTVGDGNDLNNQGKNKKRKK